MTTDKKEPFGVKILSQAKPLDVVNCQPLALKPAPGRKYQNGYNDPLIYVPWLASGVPGIWQADWRSPIFELVPQKDARTSQVPTTKINYSARYFSDILILNTDALQLIDRFLSFDLVCAAIDYYTGEPPAQGKAHWHGPWVGFPGMSTSPERLIDRFGPSLQININHEIESPARLFAIFFSFYLRSVPLPPPLQMQYCLEPSTYPAY